MSQSSSTTEAAYEAAASNQSLTHLPGEYGLPFVGKSFAMLRDPVKMFGDHRRQFGTVSRISITGSHCVLASDPAHAHQILVDRQNDFSAKMGWRPMMNDFFQGGIVMRDFDEHRMHRRIMQSSFKAEPMRLYSKQISAIVRASVKQWAMAPNFKFYDAIKQLLLEVAFEAFCKTHGSIDEVNAAFTDMMEGSLGMVRLDIPGMLYHRGLRGRRYLRDFFKTRIEQKRHSSETDMFTHFCRAETEDGALFPDDDVADHMVFLMLAAHDTTTSAATMAMYYLVDNPDLQASLHAEVGGWSDDAEFHSSSRSMNGLLAVLYETLRMHPPVPMILRRTVRDVELGNVPVPAHSMVCVPVIDIHRLPMWWTNPDQFRPARFYDHVSEHTQHAFQWIPFGGGQHKCIGMHFAHLLFMHTFVEVLKNYEVQRVGRDKASHNLQYFPFSKPVDGLPVRLVPRVKTQTRRESIAST